MADPNQRKPASPAPAGGPGKGHNPGGQNSGGQNSGGQNPGGQNGGGQNPGGHKLGGQNGGGQQWRGGQGGGQGGGQNQAGQGGGQQWRGGQGGARGGGQGPAARGQVVTHPAALDVRAAAPATVRPRHRLTAASFVLAVLAPTAAVIAYLFGVAHDQYASRVAFSIRGADAPQVELLGALTSGFGGAGGADAEIVYEFIRSQRMVEAAMAALPIETIYNRPVDDIVFRLGEDRPIEDVVAYWNRMTDVSFDAGSGIVQFEARAFDAESAQAIAELTLAESTRIVNALSEQAREDAVAVAREVLTEAEDRLRAVRRELRAFRDLEQQVDPTENARAAMSLAATLESELAQTRVELDTQLALVGERGPRVPYLRQKIESLQGQIAEERRRIGAGADGADGVGRAFADMVAEYEDLVVDREFAENAYVSALASFEQAQVEARRQMRYLSPHIAPTLSVQAEYPRRALLSAGVFAALCLLWATGLLIAYNIRDRR